jgi:hypothetical protein
MENTTATVIKNPDPRYLQTLTGLMAMSLLVTSGGKMKLCRNGTPKNVAWLLDLKDAKGKTPRTARAVLTLLVPKAKALGINTDRAEKALLTV